jgi:cytochrome c-type biogenesis protein CcmH
MTLFVVVAALMAALAASAVAVPLWRHRQSPTVRAPAALLIVAAAAALYPLWSNWHWHDSAQNPAAGPDVAAMVAKLETHLREDPNDVTGWVMLGRSYVALERMDDAIVAYDHAHRLDAGNAEAALGLGETMSLRAGGNITPEAAKLFEQALGIEPGNPKALLYGGFAAAARGDVAAARKRWLALKEMHPPAQIEQMLDARIAELGPAEAGNSSPGNAPEGAASDADVSVNIRIAPAIKARLTREAPLFVFAREPGGKGPPLAAKRLTSAAIGTQIHLSAADSMIPGRVLTKGHRVSITARVSFSGQPLPAAGDLFGELTYDVGQDGTRDLLIDRVAD